ncbi:MAG: FecR domain-containing protein [Odoribacter sp.]|nr:FecR domain-containing protein [Odoribacter sp.]
MNDMDDLIGRYLSGKASAEETEQLNRWLAEDEENLRYFFHCKNLDDVYHPAFSPSSIDTARALRRVCPSAARRRTIARWRNIAAVAILLISAGTLLLRHPAAEAPQPTVAVNVLQQTSSAILVLPSGEKVVLGREENRTIRERGTTVAQADSRSIHYAGADSNMTEVVYHELRIPRGGEFFLTLSDGSRVWINADTKVRYPLHFAAQERKIFVDGEAYLEVAHREDAPFKVVTPRCEVTVLGTNFNVNAYASESSHRITLAKGSVRVTSTDNGSQTTLAPGEQAVVEEADGSLTKRRVDPEVYCCWHDGRLLFRNHSLFEILTRIARQYDVHILWQNELLKMMTFSGELTCYKDIENLLDVIAETNDVKFSIKGKDISVTMP